MLYDKYSSAGLVIAAFPCPQFNNQEPGSNAEILNGLKYVRPGNGYVPKFAMFGKTMVNGDGAAPLFKYTRSVCPQPAPILMDDPMFIVWKPVTPADLTWNFEKVLFDRKGQPYKRFDPSAFPPSLETDIKFLLAQPPLSETGLQDQFE